MKLIKASYNLSEKTWTIQKVGLYPGRNELHIFMVSENEITYFDNLRFGYVLKRAIDQTVVSKYDFPPAGTTYECADRSALIVQEIELPCEVGFVLEFYAENSGEMVNGSLSVNVARPEAPFPSWIWRGEGWAAPVEPPTDRPAIWNEETKSWVDPDPELQY